MIINEKMLEYAMRNDSVVVITGPTACGKSKLAVELAKIHNGEIINADSLQVYKGLRIITAVPDECQVKQIPHHLYGVLSPDKDRSTLGWWMSEALKKIDEILARGNLPIIVGGTGLYISGLLYGVAMIPDIPESIIIKVATDFVNLGNKSFWEKLVEFDPLIKDRINQSDSQRMKRAYAVKLATGKSIVEWWNEGNTSVEHRYEVFFINKDRRYLYQQCNARFFQMIENGAIEEVMAFRKTYGDTFGTINNAIGLTEIESYLDGKMPLSDVINLAQARTRQYAKRQITWFRNKLSPDYIITENDDKIALKEMSELLTRVCSRHAEVEDESDRSAHTISSATL